MWQRAFSIRRLKVFGGIYEFLITRDWNIGLHSIPKHGISNYAFFYFLIFKEHLRSDFEQWSTENKLSFMINVLRDGKEECWGSLNRLIVAYHEKKLSNWNVSNCVLNISCSKLCPVEKKAFKKTLIEKL